jgi:hypothetical protein
MSMEKNNSIVEEALLQMKAVEDAINENAKGILASTMKEEISELVRESLGGSKKSKKSLVEQEEDDDDIEDVDDTVEDDDDVEDFDETEFDANVEVGMAPTNVEDDNQDAMPPLDMTQSPMSDVIKVFKAMGDEDGIIVKKDDGGNIHLSDTNKGSEYLIQMDEMDNTVTPMRAQTNESVLYELRFDDSENPMGDSFGSFSRHHDEEDDDDDFEMLSYQFDEATDDIADTSGEAAVFTAEGDWNESYEFDEEDDVADISGEAPVFTSEGGRDEVVYELEIDETFKPKGNVGKMKFKYPSKLRKGVTEIDDTENESEWKEMDEMDHDPFGEEEDVAGETKEAARTYGNGSKSGRGLRKGITPNRNLTFGKGGVKSESVERELNLLREKNEEYKKALDFFRNKLNEVAVFNSNLAYSTRLFTEHTTTKQEKINILRRFDNVSSIKESKNLYQAIKSELGGESTNKGVFTESIERKVIKTPQNGSATNLIETKTYENPQFLRMKDLMNKIK